jgi:xylulokinase
VTDARLIGIDVGTSSVKGVACDRDGAILARAQQPLTTSMPRPGWVEQDAQRDWWDAVRAVAAPLLQAAPAPAAVCVTGLGPCVVPVDADGAPLRPAILYGVDTRASAEIAELEARLGAETIVARGGSRLTSQAIGPKLAWLARHEPDVWARTERLLGANAFAVDRLTGEYVLDHHSASQWDPLYDLHAGDWIEEWAQEIAPGKRLPRLLWPGEQAGTVTDDAAAQTAIPAGTPVAAGTIDAWAEALSAGVREPGDLMLMYGTTMFLVATVDAPRPDARLWSTAGVRPGTYSLAGGMATSGALTSWFKELVGADDFATLLDEAAAVPPGSDGLVVLPYFLGERSPLFDPDARGVIAGLTLRHGRGHIYRALLEATAYAVRHHLDVLAEIGASPRRVVAVGGGTQGGLWPQIVSDVTGVAQEVPAETIGAAYGAARLAADAAGLPGGDWATPDHTVTPRPEAKATYDRLYAAYRELYPATRAQVHVLAALQEGAMTQP